MDLIIYHGKCPDGIVSAWIANRYLLEHGGES